MENDGVGPKGAFSETEREALYKVMRSRRDIRQFTSQPIPEDVLRRILEMAHLAPSVGFMQPWNFILISSVEIRRQVTGDLGPWSPVDATGAAGAIATDGPEG